MDERRVFMKGAGVLHPAPHPIYTAKSTSPARLSRLSPLLRTRAWRQRQLERGGFHGEILRFDVFFFCSCKGTSGNARKDMNLIARVVPFHNGSFVSL